WIQHDLAAERHEHGQFHRFLWIPPRLETIETRQQEFLAQIEKDIGRPRNGFQLLRTRLEELKTILLDQLRNGAVRTPSREGARFPMLRIYLMCERKDRDALRPIETVLRERGFDVDLPLFKGDSREISKDHRRTLVGCDAVLLYHGSGSEGWLREKIHDCRR